MCQVYGLGNRPSGSCDKQPRDDISNLQDRDALGIANRHLLKRQRQAETRVAFATQKSLCGHPI
jgi:hypothetical protein